MVDSLTYKMVGSCWLWTGKVRSNGTPTFPGKKKKNPRRVMFEMEFGDVPVGMFVIPSCGSRLCVNPGHLVLSQTRGSPARFACEADRKRAYYSGNKKKINDYSRKHYLANKDKYVAMTKERKKKYAAIKKVKETVF